MAHSAREIKLGSAASIKRPSCAAPIVETIPNELRSLHRWVVWRYERRLNKDGSEKWTKVLHDPATGRNAKSTDPSTWGSIDEALSRYRREPDRWAGIGFVFANSYGGIDLDDCRDPVTGEIEAWALEIVRQIDSYTEISPSGKGLHIFACFTLPRFPDPKTGELKSEGINKRNWHGCKIEIYDMGRFFTVTGDRLDGSTESVKERQAEVIALYERVRIETGDKPKKERAPKVERTTEAAHHTTIGDDELIQRMHALPKFEDLFTGGAHSYASDSEADFAFVSILCAATDDDEQIARIWRQSPSLERGKLDRQDYIDRTIRNARARQPETEQQKKAPLTHREQIICKLAAALNLSDQVFRTLLAVIAIANGRKTFKMAGWKLAAWLRTPEGWSAAEWKREAETDFDSERVNKQRAIESAFGSDRIKQLIEAFRSIYPMLKVKEKGGGFDIDGNRRGPSRYALDLRLIEEAEALAEQKLPERMEANNLRFADNPVLARQVAAHEAREIAAIEVAEKYSPKNANDASEVTLCPRCQSAVETVEGFAICEKCEWSNVPDPIAKLYERKRKGLERIKKAAQSLVAVCQDMDDLNVEVIRLKEQVMEVITDIFDGALSRDVRMKQRRQAREKLRRAGRSDEETKNTAFSQEKQGLNSNAQYGLDAVTDRIHPGSENAPPELSENPASYQCEDRQDFKSSDCDAPPIQTESEASEPVASVPAFNPRNVEQALADLGFTGEQRDKIAPAEAQRIIAEQITALQYYSAHDPPRMVICQGVRRDNKLPCNQPVVFGSERCPHCGLPTSPGYWRHYDDFAAVESEGFYASD